MMIITLMCELCNKPAMMLSPSAWEEAISTIDAREVVLRCPDCIYKLEKKHYEEESMKEEDKNEL